MVEAGSFPYYCASGLMCLFVYYSSKINYLLEETENWQLPTLGEKKYIQFDDVVAFGAARRWKAPNKN